MAAENEALTPPENHQSENKEEKEITKMEEEKTDKEGEETKEEPSEKDAKRKDENSSPPALDKEKDTKPSETKTADGQEKPPVGTTQTLPQKSQTNSQQPYVQYVPPYRAIVRGMTGEVLGGSKKISKDSKTSYRDFSKMTDPIPDGRNRGGVAEVFPIKLHR